MAAMTQTTLAPTPVAALERAPRPAPPLLLWAAIASFGWAGLAWLGSRMFASSPPNAGFDLELLLVAGRRVASGLSPYDPGIVAGRAPAAEDLFYSYPPPVAQAFSLVAGLESGVALLLLAVVAVGGLALVTAVLARHLDPTRPALTAVLPVLAVAPFIFPFAIAILFGNLDAIFPLLYGALAIGVVSSTRSARLAAGASLAVMSIAKLHPALLSLWFLVRGLREYLDPAWATNSPVAGPGAGLAAAAGPQRRGTLAANGPWLILVAALGTGLAVLAVSLLAGGLGPWQDYLAVVRTGSAADLVDRRNIGPAAQIALVLGGSESLARLVAVLVSLGAAAATALVAWRCRDALLSLAIAATLSLVTLPVTWYHYPVALLPFAIAAWLRVRGTPRSAIVLRWGALAGVVAALSIVLPVTLWLGVAAVLVAVQASVPNNIAAFHRAEATHD